MCVFTQHEFVTVYDTSKRNEDNFIVGDRMEICTKCKKKHFTQYDRLCDEQIMVKFQLNWLGQVKIRHK